MRKKLIEVALPLEAINAESAREKSIRHGHPSTLHLWWARRPLAACRAVLWASLVDDPSSWPEKFPTEAEQTKERQRLFDILGRITIETDKKGNQKQKVRGLVSWDDIKDEQTINEAQREIARCLAWSRGEEPPTNPEAVRDYIAQHAPPVYDPFAGGGSIPLEAQRLGLEAHASDLNPVAVLINKALIEIPPRFKDCPPVNPEERREERGVRSEKMGGSSEETGEGQEEKNALSGTDCLAKGDESSTGDISSRTETSKGGNLRDEITNNKSSSINSSEYRRGMDKGVQQGQSSFSSNLSGFSSRDRDTSDPMRTGRVVSSGGDAGSQGFVGGSQSDTNNDASEDENRELRGEESEVRKAATQSSLLFPLSYKGAQGLAADVRFYGQWMRDEAFQRIGHLYPQVELPEGGKATVIAWIWARSVRCPNPACGCQMPLVRSFQLSKKKGRTAWVEPVVEERREKREDRREGEEERREKREDRREGEEERREKREDRREGEEERREKREDRREGEEERKQDNVLTSNSSLLSPGDNALTSNSSLLSPRIRFEVRTGEGEIPEGTVQRKGARCLACETPVGLDYVRSEGKAKRMSQQLMAVVAESKQGRVYLSPTVEHIKIANSAEPTWKPEADLPKNTRDFKTPNYGMRTFAELFTPRQLVALTTFSDLVTEVKEKVIEDAINAGLSDDDITLENGGTGVKAYAEAIGTYLAFGVSRLSNRSSTICIWNQIGEKIEQTFARQAIPMTWDFAEANIFSSSTGSWQGSLEWIPKVVECSDCEVNSIAVLQNCQESSYSNQHLVSTDPPYYDNIGYSDLSDFFYVWLRRSLHTTYPPILNTLLTPKAHELVATPYRFNGDKQKAQTFFEKGLGKAFNQMHTVSHADYPMTVYYAFKQTEAETKGNGDQSIASTGWETMLEGLMKAGFSIDGTWPMRTERPTGVKISMNALASSIVLVCRPRPETATQTTRRQFLSELKRELPKALKTLQQGNIAPVDLAQASIGPGMAIYSQYTAVLENDGSPMPVRTALQLINQILDEFLTEQEGEFDGDTRWALTWFEQNQFNPGQYGDAETLSKAKNTSVQGMVEAGIIEAKAGKVRLLKREELPTDWTPDTNTRMPDWELTQYLIRELLNNGEMGAAELLSKLGDRGEGTRDLAYRLYSLCERKNWAQDAIAYNSLVTAWPEITRLAIEFQSQTSQQTTLDF
ncbi:DUF1156 domain-containing protein [Dactylococcopsis salina]|uniref:Adenine-specific DNA methylase containing a Zn-ribbon n=1 Tax=Dactylococcopsis salina (strain PCC 8305) TaxID=13035 RepID=K9YS27_DACS8|nr:DUF1156 domain-containing protein [Dactylococcopsis salina]AFZ48918.1 adenine-specific DNA methylase containing a Zn-ribbon [Dactylococcopsis salina PCC 8305]